MGDEDLYLIATNEVDEDRQNEALWSKSMALCNGDNSKAKYKYISLRVEMLGAETLSATSVETNNKPADSEDLNVDMRDQAINSVSKKRTEDELTGVSDEENSKTLSENKITFMEVCNLAGIETAAVIAGLEQAFNIDIKPLEEEHALVLIEYASDQHFERVPPVLG